MSDTESGKPKNKQKGTENRPEHPDQQKARREESRARRQAKRDKREQAGGDLKSTRRDGADSAGDGTHSKSEKPELFPVVGVGASAGGLEALEAFVSKLPKDSAIAFIIVTHSHPEHKTRLPELLKRKAQAKIRALEDGMEIEPGVVYIPPSDKDPVLKDGKIRLRNREVGMEIHMPIDIFLRSLAEERGDMAGCVILSGTGTDGTLGVRTIKEKAGVAVAQSRDSARHAGMPKSAIETGLVDFVLPPEKIAEQLIAFFQHTDETPYKSHAEEDVKEKEWDREHLQKILSHLEEKTRHDFSLYKKSTLLRRIERRMSVTRSNNTSEYLKVLYRDENEVLALFQNLLIGVTNFFRDPEVFDYLQKKVLPDLISRSRKEALRVWIPGCSTGEEAYSVVICLKECMEAQNVHRDMQIFGTDIDPEAIEKARGGFYPENIATDVSAERLDRFFSKDKRGYRVKKGIREPVVFAEQNVLRDPPFLNLDLLVCRNLLIYLEPQVQKQLIPLFHYALNSNGVLFLGTSESVGDYTELFKPMNKKCSIYKKQRTSRDIHPNVNFPVGGNWRKTARSFDRRQKHPERPEDSILATAAERILLKDHAPTAVITTKEGDILYIHGRAGKYLEPAEGKANLQIKEMAREGLRFRLSSAMRRAEEKDGEVREEGIQVKTNGDFARLNLIVKPLRESSVDDCLMFVFEETAYPVEEAKEKVDAEDTDCRRVAEVERELSKLQQDYRRAVEELETSNEELRSLNEELNSSNEELQSTNEELESSREELQSLNEELNTVNVELQDKIQETQDAYNAISEVLNSTRIALVFLDRDLCVEQFTREAGELVNLIEKDVGRPLGHISHKLRDDNLDEKVRSVLDTLTPLNEEVCTKEGNWYRMRIMVRHTSEHVIQGVVITFVNIDAEKEAIAQVEKSEKRFRAMVEANSEVLYRMSPDWSEMRQLHSRGFLAETKSPDRDWLEKYIPSQDRQRVIAAIKEAVENKSVFEMKHAVRRKDGTLGQAFSRAVPILDENGEIKEWFGAVSKVTE